MKVSCLLFLPAPHPIPVPSMPLCPPILRTPDVLVDLFPWGEVNRTVQQDTVPAWEGTAAMCSIACNPPQRQSSANTALASGIHGCDFIPSVPSCSLLSFSTVCCAQPSASALGISKPLGKWSKSDTSGRNCSTYPLIPCMLKYFASNVNTWQEVYYCLGMCVPGNMNTSHLWFPTTYPVR